MIKLEVLTGTKAMVKIPYFLYGKKFKLKIDQKPLESILAQTLTEARLRLQWQLKKALPYSFDVKYIGEVLN